MKTNHDGTVTLNAYDTWTSCVACGQRVTNDSIHTCSPQIKELTDRIAELSKNVDELEEELLKATHPNAEPVAWVLADKKNKYIRSIMAVQHDFVPQECVEIPLYTTPQIKELSDEEIIEIGNAVVNLIDSNEGWIEFAKAILKKASEK